MADPYTQLLELRRSEAAARGLAKIPRDFYASTTGYLAETRQSYEVDLRENPSSRRGEISRNTHQRASQVARDIVEARISKMLSAAFQASVGGTRDLPNALPEERALFDRLVQSLTDYRRTSAPYLEAGATPMPAEPSSGHGTSHPAAPATVPLGDAHATPPTTPPPHLEYVHILKDSRALQVGRDTVDLRKEDILSVPPETAQILVASKLAERVRPAGPSPVT